MYYRFVIIIILIFVNKINAMDILQKNRLETFSQKWNFISDEVMGGLSKGNFGLIDDVEESFIRLSGVGNRCIK